jgi:hypothetical protein
VKKSFNVIQTEEPIGFDKDRDEVDMVVKRPLHFVINDNNSLAGDGHNAGRNHDIGELDDLDLNVPDDIGTPMRTPGHGTPS